MVIKLAAGHQKCFAVNQDQLNLNNKQNFRFKLISFLASFVFLSAQGVPVHAIQNGTAPLTAPNLVQVIKQNADGNRYGGCSGALLAPRIVITAAHCVTEEVTGLLSKVVWVSPPGAKYKEHSEDGKNYSILENTNTLAESRALYEKYRAISIQITSTYYSSSDIVEDNDVAFLVLSEPLPVTTNITLASDEETQNFINQKTTARIYGYGKTKFDGGVSLVPMTTTMTVDFLATDVKNSVYLTSSTSSACPGDSGGPVIISTPTKLYLLGVISGGPTAVVGPECARKIDGYYFTLVTLVTKYANLAFAAAVEVEKSLEAAKLTTESELQKAKETIEKSEAELLSARSLASSAETSVKNLEEAKAKVESDFEATKLELAELKKKSDELAAMIQNLNSQLAVTKKRLTSVCKVKPKPKGC